MTYQSYLTIWLSDYVKPSAKTRTFERYAAICEILSSMIGKHDLECLSTSKLQHVITTLLSNGRAPSTVNLIITVMQSSLKTAYALGYTENNLAEHLKRPRQEAPEISCFTVKEQKKLEEAILQLENPKYFGILLCLYTGLRIGELMALTWEDMDLESGTLSVNKSCHDAYDENGHYYRLTEDPKTRASRRTIPIPHQLLFPLKALKKKKISPFVVADSEKILSVRSYQRSFELLLKKEKIAHHSFHSLRHTFATRALECGMDVKTLSEILGHKDTSITLNRYTHSMPEHKIAMMNKLGKLIQMTSNELFDEQYIP